MSCPRNHDKLTDSEWNLSILYTQKQRKAAGFPAAFCFICKNFNDLSTSVGIMTALNSIPSVSHKECVRVRESIKAIPFFTISV